MGGDQSEEGGRLPDKTLMKKSTHFLLQALVYLFAPLVAHAEGPVSCRSIAESMKEGVFVQACRITPTEIVVNGSRVGFKEAWVERHSIVNYWLGIFPVRKIVATEYCLLISITGPKGSLIGFNPGLWKLRAIKYPVKRGGEDRFFEVIWYRYGTTILSMPMEKPQDQYEMIILDKYKGKELGVVNIVNQ